MSGADLFFVLLVSDMAKEYAADIFMYQTALYIQSLQSLILAE